MLSDQSIPPSSGMTKSRSGLSALSWTMSPDQASAMTTLPLARSVVYSLPVNLRIWPLRFCSSRYSIAARTSSIVASVGLLALHPHDVAERVARLGEQRDLALVLRVEELLERLDVADLLAVEADAGHARLPRQRVLAALVPGDVDEVVVEVRRVRDVLLVDRLDVAEADPARGHPVGQRDEVAADRRRPARAAGGPCRRTRCCR